ncbi:MAG TPA: serine hydrolase domain-containing protein [Gemmatimonadales bacterium]|jgi:CubicO group peptidase (beta-lactamase class C family)|nr:serine hydrolase domain-containing protein [Gemmatimonadales bacterium]
MKRVWLSGMAWLSLLGPARGQTPTPLDSVNRYITAEMERQRIPGLSVAILRGDQMLLSRGYGFANLELRVPASDSTIYQSGSLGKQFTAAAVAMLAERGQLSLDDGIVKWLPEGAGVWNGIRVRHLLTHTSGIAEYTDSTFDYRKDYTEDQLVRFAASRPLDFPPGERWSYSNTGYAVLGVLVHRATGHFYGEILRDLIFAPAGMRSTRIISEADIVPNRSAGYQLLDGGIKNQDWVAPTLNTTADGSLYLSVNDLARWAVALNHRQTPSAAVLARAWTPVRLNNGGEYAYGLGWDLTEQRGHPRIGHTGSWQGFKTALYRYPEPGLTVIVLANLAQAEPGAIAEGIAGILAPPLQPPQLLPAALAGPRPPTPIPDLLARIAGGTDSGVVTPGLRSFLSAAGRKELRDLLSNTGSWTDLGCDRVGGRKITRLRAGIERICYARGVREKSGVVASVYYTRDWRAANFDTGWF